MEDAASIFGSNSEVLIVTSRYALHVNTEVKDIIMSYPYITLVMVESHCEILWTDNSGSGLGRHPTANYNSGIDDAAK